MPHQDLYVPYSGNTPSQTIKCIELDADATGNMILELEY